MSAPKASPQGGGLRPPPPGFAVRLATWDDLDDVVDLYNACSLDRIGEAIHERDDIHHRWLEPDRFEETLIAEDASGRIVGYGEFHADRDPWTDELDLYLEARVHPDATGRGLGTFYLDRATDAAWLAAEEVAPDQRVALRTTLADATDRGRALFERLGFVPVRHFLDMRLDLTEPPPLPEVRSRVRIRRMALGVDDEAVWRAYEAGFADHWDHEPQEYDDWRYIMMDREEELDPSLWFLAETRDGEIVGVCICRQGALDDPDLGYVRDLTVVPGWRGRGLAMALLRTAFAAFHDRGLRRVGLEVDDVTLSGAARLYERAGMTVARRTDVYEKELRPAGR